MLESDLVDGVRILRLNSPPVNAITLPLLEDLHEAIGRAALDAAVQGIVITGDAVHFSAGADVKLFRRIASEEDAVRTSRVFQEAFQEIEDSPKPVAAALTGTVIGGALELAAACHLRVAGAGSRFVMPEVKLGIVPGAGGTQRLPRLVGVTAALRMLLTAETIDAEEALALGLVDAVCPNEQVADRAREMLRAVRSPRKTSQQAEALRDAGAISAAFEQAREQLAHARPEIIAPWRILEAVRVGLEESFEAGLLKEQEANAECFTSLAARNKIYLFFATRQTAKIPELEGVKHAAIGQVAVVGLGTMGAGIAQALILGGAPVVALDQDESALRRGAEKIRDSVRKRVEQGRLAKDRAERLLRSFRTTTQWADLAAADLVIESVYEDAAVKRSVLRELEAVCRPGAVFASNTSTISLDELAGEMRHPDRLIGMHFFNPAHRMPLVEIIRRDGTRPEIVAASMDLARRLGKTPVLSASREGFLVTRLFVPYVQEAFALLEEGAAPAAIDAAAVAFGFPMGPLVLMDMTGLDILVRSQRVLVGAFPRHGRLSPIAVRLVDRGCLGQKTGSGVYAYDRGSHEPRECGATVRLIDEIRREAGASPRSADREEIVERLVLRMVGEAFYLLEEEVARSPSDVDVATVLGVGFPDFRGGVLKYANDLGRDKVLARLEELSQRWGERFAPCQWLRKAEGVS